MSCKLDRKTLQAGVVRRAKRVARDLASISVVCASLIFASPFLHAAEKESLLIGPGDVLRIQVADTPELEQHPRVTDSGDIPVQGAGTIHVTGLTPAEAAEAVRKGLIEAHYMRHPEVTVNIEQYATQNVSVIGEVRNPGAYPAGTPRSVLDVLALAGGLNNTADRDIAIQRRSGEGIIRFRYSNDSAVLAANAPIVYPGDTIIVSRAGIVYVLGDVNRPGGYVMSTNDAKMSVLQAIALAGGTAKTAKQGEAKLLRHENGSVTERTISINRLETGKIPDIEMSANDVLYVPFSYGKNLAVFGSSGVVAAASSAAIYAIP